MTKAMSGRHTPFGRLEADQNAVAAERNLQAPASCIQPHGDALAVAKPEPTPSLITQRPTFAELDIGAGKIVPSDQTIDRSGCRQARGANAANTQVANGATAKPKRASAHSAGADEGDLKLLDSDGGRRRSHQPAERLGRSRAKLSSRTGF
jgi:hypothetical protein